MLDSFESLATAVLIAEAGLGAVGALHGPRARRAQTKMLHVVEYLRTRFRDYREAYDSFMASDTSEWTDAKTSARMRKSFEKNRRTLAERASARRRQRRVPKIAYAQISKSL